MIYFSIKKMDNKRGFTLTELLIVVAILAILAALVAPRFFGVSKAFKIRTDEESALILAREVEVLLLSGVLGHPMFKNANPPKRIWYGDGAGSSNPSWWDDRTIAHPYPKAQYGRDTAGNANPDYSQIAPLLTVNTTNNTATISIVYWNESAGWLNGMQILTKEVDLLGS